MSDTDLRELQKDTYVIVIAIVIVLSFILFYINPDVCILPPESVVVVTFIT
jgi:hypothetical protein